MITNNRKDISKFCSSDQSNTKDEKSLKGIFKQEISEEEIKLGMLAKYENLD